MVSALLHKEKRNNALLKLTVNAIITQVMMYLSLPLLDVCLLTEITAACPDKDVLNLLSITEAGTEGKVSFI